MTLGDAIEQLEHLDGTATIYAARPWTRNAAATVAVEPDDGTAPDGYEYFLEVDAALIAAQVSTAGTRFERVLHYAEHDAFLFDDAPH